MFISIVYNDRAKFLFSYYFHMKQLLTLSVAIMLGLVSMVSAQNTDLVDALK